MNVKYLAWLYREYIKAAKNVSFCEEFHSENGFEAILTNFCCYDYGANASEAVQKISTRTQVVCQLAKTANFIATPNEENIFSRLLPDCSIFFLT